MLHNVYIIESHLLIYEDERDETLDDQLSNICIASVENPLVTSNREYGCKNCGVVWLSKESSNASNCCRPWLGYRMRN